MQPGTTILNTNDSKAYQVKKLIGIGAFGMVYHVTCTNCEVYLNDESRSNE